MSNNQINGVVITELRQINDKRGAVLHMLRCDDSKFKKFGECYFSEVLPSTVKAWKCHVNQTQNLAVPVGRIKIVIFDDRESSLTKGNLMTLELGRPDSYFRLLIPPNLWYGFSCVSKVPALIANCVDLPHDPNDSKVLAMDDYHIPYKWNFNRIN